MILKIIVSHYNLNRGGESAILTDDNDFIVSVKVATWLKSHSFKKTHFIV